MATLFFSYSHRDEGLRDELEAHLGLLKNQGLIETWHDRRIVAGDNLDEAISANLESADLILLLVSSDFISSYYCYSKEMTRALERHAEGSARVIAVILRHCDWQSAPFAKALVAPKDGRAVTSWPDKDEAFTDVVRQIRKALESNARSAMVTPLARVRDNSGTSVVGAQEKTLPRSSNMRLKKEFTEHDRHDFVRSAFEFICRFFMGSLEELQRRNSNVKTSFDRIDLRTFAATAFRDGKLIAQCSVRLGGFARENGITFSYDTSAPQNSMNEMLTVEHGEQSLYLKAMGMGISYFGAGSEKSLTEDGAAELFWSLFIKNAQM